MKDEIESFVNLDGLGEKEAKNEKKNNRILVKHDEVHVTGKGIVQDIIEKNKNI